MLKLSIAEVVGYLGWCFCGYAAYLFVWTIWKGSRPKHAERWMRFVAECRYLWKRSNRGIAKWSPVIFVMFWCAAMLFAVARLPKYEIVTEHHVHVIGRLADGDWAMSSDEQGQFAFRGCHDFDVDSVLSQAVGYVADHARWEERGNCKSIRRADLGFWWRDKNFAYRRAN